MPYTDWNSMPIMRKLKEAAAVLNVHTNTVHTLVGDGRLKAQKLDKERHFAKAKLRRFIEHPDAPPGSDVYDQTPFQEKCLARLELRLMTMDEST